MERGRRLYISQLSQTFGALNGRDLGTTEMVTWYNYSFQQLINCFFSNHQIMPPHNLFICCPIPLPSSHIHLLMSHNVTKSQPPQNCARKNSPDHSPHPQTTSRLYARQSRRSGFKPRRLASVDEKFKPGTIQTLLGVQCLEDCRQENPQTWRRISGNGIEWLGWLMEVIFYSKK